MNKRGFEKEYLLLFYFILGVMIGLIILNYVNQIRNDASYNMKKLSIDSAFLMDTLTVVPFDINIKASFAKEGYLLNFKNNPCIVESYTKTTRVISYYYSCFNGIDFQNKEIESLFINFEKKGNNVVIS